MPKWLVLIFSCKKRLLKIYFLEGVSVNKHIVALTDKYRHTGLCNVEIKRHYFVV